jgi:hypothetical protein
VQPTKPPAAVGFPGIAVRAGAKMKVFGGDGVPKWRATVDEDGQYRFAVAL